MNAHDLVLLSSYRLPTDSALYLGDEEISAFLNGWAALWHPAALACAATLPKVAAPHEHESPQPDHLFALPDLPTENVPEDWRGRVAEAGGIVFTATADRQQTTANLLEALKARYGDEERLRPVWDVPPERVAAFQGIGFGYIVLGALFEAMQHDNLLPIDDLTHDLAAALEALGDEATCRLRLQSAADRLMSAREVVYQVTLHLLDFSLLEANRLDAPWPASFAMGQPLNVIATADTLTKLQRERPEVLRELREKVAAGLVEVVGGGMLEREEPFLPLESQVWNLLRGRQVSHELLGQEVRIAARKRFGWHPQSPLLLWSSGFTHALQVTFDDSVLPSHHSAVVNWPSHDSKQVTSYTRPPQPADSPQTYFHLAHHLHQTIMQDHVATLALLHRDKPACPAYQDWLELSRFAPVLGSPTTLSKFFSDGPGADYSSPMMPDDLQCDYLNERVNVAGLGNGAPISAFTGWQRGRRNIDAAWTFAALLHSLGGKVEDVAGQAFFEWLREAEDRFEQRTGPAEEPATARDRAGEALAKRLTARGQPNSPGWLVLNPCSFTRRVALELPGVSGVLPLTGPIKACQADAVVVEVPPLGFAWVPRQAPSGSPAPSRLRMTDERCIRNEFLEAEIDLQTGGLKAIRDIKTRTPRLGQQLVYAPGSSMQARGVQVTSAGPALAEMVSHGVILDEQQQELAEFRQRFRLWLGRPMLEMRIEINPKQSPSGYPWHAYYGARFAWRDEGTALLRGSTGLTTLSSVTRPESADFVELRIGGRNAVIFPGGLPFHQRHGGRMLDVLLVCEGETARSFDLGIGVDRESPAQTALGVTSPVAVVPLNQGPPHVGATGWLYHLDAPNVLLTSLRPRADGGPGVVATLLECAGHGGEVEFRCARNPTRAVLADLSGIETVDAVVEGDRALFNVSANDLLQVRVDFS